MNSLARRLGRILTANSTAAHDEEMIRYGLEVFLGALLQVVLLVIAGWYLGLLKVLLSVVIPFSLLRRLAGGAHCTAYYRCTIAGLVIFPLLAYLCRFINSQYFWFYLIITASFSLVVIYMKAPVDTEVKPINDPQERSRLKTRAAFLSANLLIAASFIYWIGQGLIAIAVLMGIFYQTLTMTRPGVLYMRFLDIVLSSWWVKNLGKEET